MNGLSAQQMRDVLTIVEGLNAFDNPDDNSRDVEGIEWGGGLRAVLGATRIPVWSDYLDIEPREHLGYVVQGDFGWTFVQEPVSEPQDVGDKR